jgi:hypothetical protein
VSPNRIRQRACLPPTLALCFVGACELGEPDQSYAQTELVTTILSDTAPHTYTLDIDLDIEDPETVEVDASLVVDRHSGPTVSAGLVTFTCPEPFDLIASGRADGSEPAEIRHGDVWVTHSSQDAPLSVTCDVSLSATAVPDEPIEVVWRAELTTMHSARNDVHIEMSVVAND